MKTSGIKSILRLTALLSGVVAGGRAQAQPGIKNAYPNGNYQFQYAPTLSFTATSATAVTNVVVQLTSTTLTGQSSFKTLTPGNGLTVSGPANSETVSTTLKSNYLY